MKVRIDLYDPAQLTIDEAEAINAAGLELEMTPDNKFAAYMEIGDLFPVFNKEEDKRYDLESEPDCNRISAGGI